MKKLSRMGQPSSYSSVAGGSSAGGVSVSVVGFVSSVVILVSVSGAASASAASPVALFCEADDAAAALRFAVASARYFSQKSFKSLSVAPGEKS